MFVPKNSKDTLTDGEHLQQYPEVLTEEQMLEKVELSSEAVDLDTPLDSSEVPPAEPVEVFALPYTPLEQMNRVEVSRDALTPWDFSMIMDMYRHCLSNNVIGLASNQVGYNDKKVFLMLEKMKNQIGFVVLFNPSYQALKKKKSIKHQENYPNLNDGDLIYNLDRWNEIILSYESYDEEHQKYVPRSQRVRGKQAYLVQHFIDILNGVFINKKGRFMCSATEIQAKQEELNKIMAAYKERQQIEALAKENPEAVITDTVTNQSIKAQEFLNNMISETSPEMGSNLEIKGAE